MDELNEYTSVLEKLLRVRDIVLKVNLEYIYSAAQADEYRSEPAFKLQGSYRNMNKIAEKVVPVMNEEELFEKIVASCSKQNLWVIDSTKYVNKLGKFLLPVEVIPMGYAHIMRQLQEEGYSCKLRKSGTNNYYTDSGNVILDLDISKVLEYEELNQRLLSIPGVVETGLFLNIADKIILPEEGRVKVLAKPLV